MPATLILRCRSVSRRRPAAFKAGRQSLRVAATAEPEAQQPARAAREVTVNLADVAAGDQFEGVVVRQEGAALHACGPGGACLGVALSASAHLLLSMHARRPPLRATAPSSTSALRRMAWCTSPSSPWVQRMPAAQTLVLIPAHQECKLTYCCRLPRAGRLREQRRCCGQGWAVRCGSRAERRCRHRQDRAYHEG